MQSLGAELEVTKEEAAQRQEELRLEIEALQASMAEKETELQQSRYEEEKLEADVAGLKKEIQRLEQVSETQLRQSIEDNDNLNEVTAQVKEEAAEKSRAIEFAEDNKRSLQMQEEIIDGLKEEIAKLNEHIEEKDKKLLAQVGELEEMEQSLRSKDSSNARSLPPNQVQVETQTLEKLHIEIKELKKRIKAKDAAQRKRIKELEEANKLNTYELGLKNTKIEELEEGLESKTYELALRNKKRSEYAEALNTEIEQLKQELAAKKAEVEAVTHRQIEESTESTKEIVELTKALDDTESRLQTEIHQKMDEIQKLQDYISKLQDELQKAGPKKTEQVRETNRQITAKETSASPMKLQIREMKMQIRDMLTDENDPTIEDPIEEELETELRLKTKENEKLKKDIERLKKRPLATGFKSVVAADGLDLLAQHAAKNMPALVPGAQQMIAELVQTIAGNDAVAINHALSQLTELLNKEEQGQNIRVALFRSGGYLVIVSAMRRHIQSADIQEEACRLLSAFALLNKSLSYSAIGGMGNICIGLAATGGFEGILNAMEAFPDDLKLNKRGLRAVNNLISSKDLVPLFFDLNIFGTLSRCMSNFPEDPSIQEDGCRILRFTCAYPKARERFKKKGALRVVAGVLERFDAKSPTYNQAMRAWNSLLLGK